VQRAAGFGVFQPPPVPLQRSQRGPQGPGARGLAHGVAVVRHMLQGFAGVTKGGGGESTERGDAWGWWGRGEGRG